MNSKQLNTFAAQLRPLVKLFENQLIDTAMDYFEVKPMLYFNVVSGQTLLDLPEICLPATPTAALANGLTTAKQAVKIKPNYWYLLCSIRSATAPRRWLVPLDLQVVTALLDIMPTEQTTILPSEFADVQFALRQVVKHFIAALVALPLIQTLTPEQLMMKLEANSLPYVVHANSPQSFTTDIWFKLPLTWVAAGTTSSNLVAVPQPATLTHVLIDDTAQTVKLRCTLNLA